MDTRDEDGMVAVDQAGPAHLGTGDDDESPMWLLPDEILLDMLRRLEVTDLCSMIQTCRRIYALGNTRTVQAATRFPAHSWPFRTEPPVPEDGAASPKSLEAVRTNVPVFERAARHGNFEANIKLGVALLYGEGLLSAHEQAYEMLNRAEELVGSVFPFAWLLFRPPWSSATCSKAAIFNRMKKQAEENMATLARKHCGVMFCVAKTLSLLPTAAESSEAEKWFEHAATKGCGDAAFELFKLKQKAAPVYDLGARTDAIRQLRAFDSSSSWNVEAALCYEYACGNYAGKTPAKAQAYFRAAVLSQARRTAAHCLELPEDGDDERARMRKMRYILVDWLVEVADLKAFTRDTLYMTVGLVDRYLQRFDVTRKTLQLLGISCMVIAARFTETEVITIREAAWLTDNTYKYEQVVRTMGSALCAAGGKLRIPTTLDFVRLFVAVEKVPGNVEEVLHYVSELVLLHIPVGQIPAALTAAAAYFLTAVGMHLPAHRWWPDRLASWTGLRLDDIGEVVFRVQTECFKGEAIMDHRDEKLKAVADRYARRAGHKLEDSGFTEPKTEEIRQILAERGAFGIVDMADEADEELVAGSPFGAPAAAAAAAAAAAFGPPDDTMDDSPEDPACAAAGTAAGIPFAPIDGNTRTVGMVGVVGGSKRQSADPGRQETPTLEGDGNFMMAP